MALRSGAAVVCASAGVLFTGSAFLLPGVQRRSALRGPAAEPASVQHGVGVRPQAPGGLPVLGLLAGAGAGAVVVRASRRTQGQRRPAAGKPSQRLVATLDRPKVDAAEASFERLQEYVKVHGGSRPFRRVLIANNGMAATKAMLSMRQWACLELGTDVPCFEFVVMATREDLDANAEFIRLADTYVEVPGGSNRNNYANVDLICEVAQAQKVDAVWPGWGHASENPKLPAKLKELGIVFVGPTSPVMSVLGDKIAANILAQTAGVSSIPWSGDGLKAELTAEGTIPDEIFQKGLINTLDEAFTCADRIGYPVMLKASEGGGGKGIRMSATREELERNYPQVLAEVPGSPVFMMQLCQGARHIEVQIVGDMHGHAVALSGRDCTTQRRFQKIFEEGPPSIVPKETFLEMERAAQRLTQSIGYIGAGTVEYLFNAASGMYYFLELNPRLQVEHPVTEEITGVNLPATQLQVLMGIPLEKIPQIRKFYGKDDSDLDSPIDFMVDNYVYPTKHVIAARITAENPDDGFKPTSGKIQRIKFQSSVNCWGYFSVGANGAIHEYADSQFGHIFARGRDREESRKVLKIALKQLDVAGEIRTPLEYLVELLNTPAFIENSITTSWLDGLIREKSVKVKYDPLDVVFHAAVFRAMQTLKAKEEALLEDLSKSQLGMLRQVKSLNRFPVEITFEGTKYAFQVTRRGSDRLELKIGAAAVQARVRTQPDGSIFASVGSSVRQVVGSEEALGLRLKLSGAGTVLLPNVFDASELRSEFNGKIVRFLQPAGALVKQGEPYVELEAMKMIMPIRATASGKVFHLKGAGSIVSAGELLAQLQLDDPSSVQKIEPFSGAFALPGAETGAAEGDALEQAILALDGYEPSEAATSLVQRLFAGTPEESQSLIAASIIDRYLEVEKVFAQAPASRKSEDEVLTELIAKNSGELKRVVSLVASHSQLALRNELLLATLRSVRGLHASKDLVERLELLAELPTGQGYDEVVQLARMYTKKMAAKPFAEQLAALKKALLAGPGAPLEVSQWTTATGGEDLLCALLADGDAAVRRAALETYVRRIYRSFKVTELEVTDAGASRISAKWRFQFPGTSGVVREGLVNVVPTASDVKAVLSAAVPLSAQEGGVLTNSVHVLVTEDVLQGLQPEAAELALASMCSEVTGLLTASSAAMKAAGVRDVCLMLAHGQQLPRYAHFLEASGWKEEQDLRDMKPKQPELLEVQRLAQSYDLTPMPHPSTRRAHVFLGTSRGLKAGKQAKPSTVFVRMISHSVLQVDSDDWMVLPESRILKGVDEVDRVTLGLAKGEVPNSHIFLHLISSVDVSAKELNRRFEHFMNTFVARHVERLQRAKVDEIVIKVGLGKSAEGRSATLRFSASSMSGEYLKTTCVSEVHDPVTGQPVSWSDIESGEAQALSSGADSKIQQKRVSARKAGSTYALEFLGMMKVGLIEKWNAYTQAVSSAKLPDSLFEARELVLDPANGELKEVTRAPGANDIGMLAWRCTLRTPEYPEGRDVILIANDVTHQAGSFGVSEDVFFQKASEYARRLGLPRVYISCNSGARVGLVEELKPFVQAKWLDASDPVRGFEFLYLSEADYARFGPGVVAARPVQHNGETVYALDAIIGEGMKSSQGGIGVENLQGSGLIAGETSRAYNQVFTLSYVSGRSVGIGAYLNRLGQRTIQMVNSPMILTGYAALNKLLGRTVYTSQDQLGGPQIMVPNGVTHQLVQSDQEGVSAILDWLSYVPKTASSLPPVIATPDSPERDIGFLPSKTPYDPRHMLAGTVAADGTRLSGFFDEGTFREYLGGWGRSVVIGRAKLGGIPMGVIAVETRNVERRIPADPANPSSREVIEPQAGQVWFPDSAFKTATALRDFNRGENLPVMIFANWRGFSGGTRDMFSEVLKFGAQIVDALTEYRHPVFVYIPPGGELRGGSWVVIDPCINPAQMEMYADVDSRGGILEPAGIVEVKFRQLQQVQMMHRLDEQLIALDAQLEAASATQGDVAEVEAKIRAREDQLKPLYTQLACEFADLHDRTGRMEAKGVIRKGLEWRRARSFFHTRLRRRLLEKDVTDRLRRADTDMTDGEALAKVRGWLPSDVDEEALAFLEQGSFQEALKEAEVEATKRKIKELEARLAEQQAK